MNQNKGASPFANMALAGGDSRVEKVVSNLQGNVDSRAVKNERKVTSKITKPRAKSRQIYFSADVDAELTRLKDEERANISAVVEKAVRLHLGI